MSSYLMLVADHASARLLRMPDPHATPEELSRLDNPAGHGHERDLGTSAPGRGTGGGEGRRTAYEPAQSLREHATEVFAQHIAVAVAKATAGVPEDQLVVVAGPAMLGVLRQHLPAGQRQALEWPHNLANLPDADLHRRLREAATELRKA